MRRWLVVLGLGALFAFGTWGIGWWTVPVIGWMWGATPGRPAHPVVTAAGAAAGAWAALLALAALRGPVGELAIKLGGIMGVAGWVLVAATVLLPALLAGAGAGVAVAVVGGRRRV